MGKTLALTPEQRALNDAAGLTWWYDATYEGKVGPIHPEQPQPGYYRCRDGAHAPWVPAFITRDKTTGDLRAARGFRGQLVSLDLDELKRAWPFWAKERVTWEVYQPAYETGEWPVATGGFGSNALPDKPTGWEALKIAIDLSTNEALKWIEQFAKDGKHDLPDQAAADKANLMAERIWGYHNQADKERKAEADEAYRRYTGINDKWFEQGGIKLAKRVRDLLVAAAKAWADREQRRRDAEALAKLKETRSLAQTPDAAPVTLATSTNKTGAKRLTFRPVLKITSLEKVRKFFRGTDDYKAMMEAAERTVLEELAKRAHAKGIDVPGTMVDKEAA